MRCWLALAVVLSGGSPVTAGWVFEPPLEVVASGGEGVFHHLESAGRKNIAASEGLVAVVWEDNRSGKPEIYAAFRNEEADAFTPAVRISEGDEAYEPALVSLDADRFLFAWEEAGRVRLRTAAPAGLGPVTAETAGSAQPTLATTPAGPRAAWVRPAPRYKQVVVADVQADGPVPAIRSVRAVDEHPPAADQLYPALAASDGGLLVAWEDRRDGHTRLYTSRGGESGFSRPRPLNALPPRMSTTYGRGTGVTRVVLGAAQNRVAAAWMDKRHFRGGYDIYAAWSGDGGRTFGPNELVQDVFGENQPQWHPTVAVRNDGRVVVAWDDPRDGTADVWLSARGDDGIWSDDVPVAGGSGSQDNPVAIFDREGRLHLAWVERENGLSRIRYTRGRYEPEP